MRKITTYLDNASTTPVDKRVLSAMMPYFSQKFGNPANLYHMAGEAKDAIVKSKEKISKVLECRPDEIIFTSTATESDNLAIIGTARASRDHGKRIIVSQIEHKGVLSACQMLEKEGFDVVYLPVDEKGQVSLEKFKEALNKETILVSVAMADNETGSIQPVREISKIIRKFQNTNGLKNFPYLHTDASQAVGYLDLSVVRTGVDLLTCSAHKIGGPKGVALLFVKRGVNIQPIIYGGGQQKKIRSGTENVPAIVGFGMAMELAQKEGKSQSTRLKKMRDTLEKGILKKIEKIKINGHPTERLPNFSNISFLGIEGEALLLYLDENGIVVSTGSACNSDSLEPSHILKAMGLSYEFIQGSIRFTFGKTNTSRDVSHVLKVLPSVIKILRSVPPAKQEPVYNLTVK